LRTRDVLVFPDPQVDEARVRAKQFLAALFRGEKTALDREWGAFDELHGKAAGHLAGQDGNYLEILKALAGKAADLTPAPAAEVWRTFAGHSARNFVLG